MFCADGWGLGRASEWPCSGARGATSTGLSYRYERGPRRLLERRRTECGGRHGRKRACGWHEAGGASRGGPRGGLGATVGVNRDGRVAMEGGREKAQVRRARAVHDQPSGVLGARCVRTGGGEASEEGGRAVGGRARAVVWGVLSAGVRRERGRRALARLCPRWGLDRGCGGPRPGVAVADPSRAVACGEYVKTKYLLPAAVAWFHDPNAKPSRPLAERA